MASRGKSLSNGRYPGMQAPTSVPLGNCGVIAVLAGDGDKLERELTVCNPSIPFRLCVCESVDCFSLASAGCHEREGQPTTAPKAPPRYACRPWSSGRCGIIDRPWPWLRGGEGNPNVSFSQIKGARNERTYPISTFQARVLAWQRCLGGSCPCFSLWRERTGTRRCVSTPNLYGHGRKNPHSYSVNGYPHACRYRDISPHP